MRIATLGAGWAGAAAAVTLARFGHDVTVFEAGPVAGGRARRVERDGLPLDNGQHLLLGAYEQTRNLLAVVHGGDGERGLLARMPLRVAPPDNATAAFALQAKPWPAPLGLAAGLLSARGLAMPDRLAAAAWFARLRARGFRCPPGTTVADLCASGPRSAAEALWYPLCLAALNTPPERACAQVFANVLRAALAGRRDASDFLLPLTDLSTLFPDAALRFVEQAGGRVRLRTRAAIAELDADGVEIAHGAQRETFDAAVVAVGPHQLDEALGAHEAFGAYRRAARALAYEPIATAWLGYAGRIALPAPIGRLDDAPGQWVLDRPDVLARSPDARARLGLAQLLAVVVSASGPHDAWPAADLATACDAQLRRLMPSLPPLAWQQAIVERRATYACVPHRPRAPAGLPHPRVALAGDWLDETFPATLEAAVRTGVAAAFALEARHEAVTG
jgi:squalene-associated FAD-dependent desaturase